MASIVHEFIERVSTLYEAKNPQGGIEERSIAYAECFKEAMALMPRKFINEEARLAVKLLNELRGKVYDDS